MRVEVAEKKNEERTASRNEHAAFHDVASTELDFAPIRRQHQHHHRNYPSAIAATDDAAAADVAVVRCWDDELLKEVGCVVSAGMGATGGPTGAERRVAAMDEAHHRDGGKGVGGGALVKAVKYELLVGGIDEDDDNDHQDNYDKGSSSSNINNKTLLSAKSKNNDDDDDDNNKKPKRPLSAYNLFFRRQRSQSIHIARKQELDKASAVGFEESRKGAVFRNLARHVGKLWRELPPEEKGVYVRRAEEEKRWYAEALVRWRTRQIQKRDVGSISSGQKDREVEGIGGRFTGDGDDDGDDDGEVVVDSPLLSFGGTDLYSPAADTNRIAGATASASEAASITMTMKPLPLPLPSPLMMKATAAASSSSASIRPQRKFLHPLPSPSSSIYCHNIPSYSSSTTSSSSSAASFQSTPSVTSSPSYSVAYAATAFDCVGVSVPPLSLPAPPPLVFRSSSSSVPPTARGAATAIHSDNKNTMNSLTFPLRRLPSPAVEAAASAIEMSREGGEDWQDDDGHYDYEVDGAKKGVEEKAKTTTVAAAARVVTSESTETKKKEKRRRKCSLVMVEDGKEGREKKWRRKKEGEKSDLFSCSSLLTPFSSSYLFSHVASLPSSDDDAADIIECLLPFGQCGGVVGDNNVANDSASGSSSSSSRDDDNVFWNDPDIKDLLCMLEDHCKDADDAQNFHQQLRRYDIHNSNIRGGNGD